MEQLEFDTLLVQASQLPLVKVDREIFLRKELKNRYSPDIVEIAVKYNPAYAGISVEEINKIAKSCITADTTRVTALSAAAGLPGGIAMAGTIPADMAQLFGHILHIMQELIYLYGWQELKMDSNEINEETKNLITLFAGVMFGVSGATAAINRIAAQVAKQVAKKLPQKALTKGVVYPIVKKVAAMLGVKMTKDVFAKGVSKAVPVIGAVVSGGLTLATFVPMCERLKKYLASCQTANPEYYKEINDDSNIQELDDVEIIADAQNEPIDYEEIFDEQEGDIEVSSDNNTKMDE